MISGFSLVCAAIVMNVYLMDPPVPMSPLMQRVVFGMFGWMVCFKHENRVEPTLCSDDKSNSNLKIIDIDQKNKDFPPNVITTNHEDKLLVEIKKLTQKIEDDKEEERLKYEWKQAGKVLDRIFLIIFGIATFLTLTILFTGVG